MTMQKRPLRDGFALRPLFFVLRSITDKRFEVAYFRWSAYNPPDYFNMLITYRKKIMPTINIQLFEGRTVEQKRELAKAITEATCKTLKCDPSAVDIIMHDVKKENWATAGKLWSD